MHDSEVKAERRVLSLIGIHLWWSETGARKNARRITSKGEVTILIEMGEGRFSSRQRDRPAYAAIRVRARRRRG